MYASSLSSCNEKIHNGRNKKFALSVWSQCLPEADRFPQGVAARQHECESRAARTHSEQAPWQRELRLPSHRAQQPASSHWAQPLERAGLLLPSLPAFPGRRWNLLFQIIQSHSKEPWDTGEGVGRTVCDFWCSPSVCWRNQRRKLALLTVGLDSSLYYCWHTRSPILSVIWNLTSSISVKQ